jgi:plasmid segregation protein ParM
MKKQSYSFPSVYEATGTDLNFVSKNLINGFQIYDDTDQAYLIGDLALREGISPNKLVNSSPHQIDYQLLLKAGILLASEGYNRPLAITTGFPFSTYQVYKKIATEYISKLDYIDYNAGTYTHNGRTKFKPMIDQVEILPEMIGNIIALRVGQAQATGNFFVVSLGFGTCEAVLSTEAGIVHRTASSINGMQYAVDLFMRSLASKYYLGLKTEKQLDISFRQDYIILEREKINIVDLRRRILERYYRDIVSMGLRRSFSDNDFEKADKIYLTGGGALFPELVEQFEKEFSQIAQVKVVDNPLTLTSEGYSLNSIMLTNGDESKAIGLDIGNANTVLTQFEDESRQIKKEEETIQREKIIVLDKDEEKEITVVDEEIPLAELKTEPITEIKTETVLEEMPQIEHKIQVIEHKESVEEEKIVLMNSESTVIIDEEPTIQTIPVTEEQLTTDEQLVKSEKKLTEEEPIITQKEEVKEESIADQILKRISRKTQEKTAETLKTTVDETTGNQGSLKTEDTKKETEISTSKISKEEYTGTIRKIADDYEPDFS